MSKRLLRTRQLVLLRTIAPTPRSPSPPRPVNLNNCFGALIMTLGPLPSPLTRWLMPVLLTTIRVSKLPREFYLVKMRFIRRVNLREGISINNRSLPPVLAPRSNGTVQVNAPFAFAGDRLMILPFRSNGPKIPLRTGAGSRKSTLR